MTLKEFAENLEMEEDECVELMDLFLKTSSSELDELQIAAENGDRQRIVWNVHSIKGTASSLGLKEIYEATERMETNVRENNLDDVVKGAERIRKELDLLAEVLNRSPKTGLRGMA